MTELAQDRYDVLVVADPRFAGGSTGALVADVKAFSELGLNIGVLFVRSAYLHDSRDRINPAAAALVDLPGVTQLSAGANASAEVAFLHHPMVFYRGIEETASLSAPRAYIVTHHAPFRADGSIEFDPTRTLRNVKASLGLRAGFAPISGIVRGQLASFAPFVSISPEDWPNVFDPQFWPEETPIFSHDELTIGRHGRPDMLKWPATQAEIANSLPTSEKVRVRVLGCPSDDLKALNVDMTGWDVIDFGKEPVADFLNSLDVFVYHFSPSWIETFGRTIAEAMLCGRLCLLDHRLKPTFGDKAYYCRPDEVAGILNDLRADPEAARIFAKDAQLAAIRDYGQSSVRDRLQRFINSVPTRSRMHASFSPSHTLRKLVGHYRRIASGATG